jgi:hypothetical protein
MLSEAAWIGWRRPRPRHIRSSLRFDLETAPERTLQATLAVAAFEHEQPMRQLVLDGAVQDAGTLVCQLRPSGRIDVRPGPRDVGRTFIGRVCGALDPVQPKLLVVPEPDPDELLALIHAAPPMEGAEFVTTELLADIWSDAAAALSVEAESYEDGVQGYLRARSSVWHVVGRVCFHLAENKRSPEYPFAFIATNVHEVSKQAKPQHLPLD